MATHNHPTVKNRAKSAPVSAPIASIVANEMSQLWQAHGIVELAVHAIGDEEGNGAPAIKQAIQGAADIILASINALEPICTPGKLEVAHVV